MTNFKIFLISVFIAFTYFNDTFSQIIIKYKVGDKIVTNADIEFEKNYLIFLKPGLDELSNEEMKLIAEKSIIRDTIKKKEIDKVFKDLNNLEIINGVKKSLFRFKNVQNEDEFLRTLWLSEDIFVWIDDDLRQDKDKLNTLLHLSSMKDLINHTDTVYGDYTNCPMYGELYEFTEELKQEAIDNRGLITCPHCKEQTSIFDLYCNFYD